MAALDEVTDFSMKFVKAVYGELFTGMEAWQMGPYPRCCQAWALTAHGRGGSLLQGTPLSSTVVESVKSAEQMAAATQQRSGGGGGLGSMLARGMMGPWSGVSAPRH
jgi:hypothetical protein